MLYRKGLEMECLMKPGRQKRFLSQATLMRLMKVCVIGDRRVVVEDKPVPVPGRGDVLVAMRACGICGTDIEKIAGNYSSTVLGHEAVGEVVSVGSEVEGVSVGERVFPHHHVPCYDCHYCRTGSETMCPHFSSSNIHPGGLSEFFVMPEWNIIHGGLFKLPGPMTYRTGTLIEPLACVLRGLDKLKLNSESTVTIVGAGPVGMLHIYALQSLGVKNIVAMDISKERCDFALAFGASAAGVPGDAMNMSIMSLTDGRGADASIIATGHPLATESGISCLRRGGSALQFGLPHPNTTLIHDISDIFRKEIQLLSTYSGVESDVAKAISMLDKKKGKADEMISHSFRLEDTPAAFYLAEKTGNAMKIIIEN